ncbi:MAG: SelB C-terminal domain-containing protein, partial [Sedimentisphaerales bacterium]|nr:SelB C-terminal domain-containing protein [Sedimentisphaerales bacterium]
VRMDNPQRIVAAPRDRFILRSLSPVQTLGGGMIIEALSHKLRRSDSHVVQDVLDREKAVLAEQDFVEYCIKSAEDFATSENELALRAKMLPGPLEKILSELLTEGKIIRLSSKLLIHRNTSIDIQQKLLDMVEQFHRDKPESPGLSAEQLYDAVSRAFLRQAQGKLYPRFEGGTPSTRNVFDGLVEQLIAEGKLAERKHRLALPEHRETFSNDEQKLLHEIESLFTSRPFNPPKNDEVIQHTQATPDTVQKSLKILIEQEHLIRVDKDLFFHRDAVEKARQLLVSYITEHGGLESVKFKYLLDTTRKFAIPLLDYFDRIGVTRRAGYTRHLKNPNTS